MTVTNGICPCFSKLYYAHVFVSSMLFYSDYLPCSPTFFNIHTAVAYNVKKEDPSNLGDLAVLLGYETIIWHHQT